MGLLLPPKSNTNNRADRRRRAKELRARPLIQTSLRRPRSAQGPRRPPKPSISYGPRPHKPSRRFEAWPTFVLNILAVENTTKHPMEARKPARKDQTKARPGSGFCFTWWRLRLPPRPLPWRPSTSLCWRSCRRYKPRGAGGTGRGDWG